MSLWRNDEHRLLDARIEHLLGKHSGRHTVRWLWVVGDSDDRTERVLRCFEGENVSVYRYDSGITGDDVLAARRRGSWTATRMFTHLLDTDDIACFHESDLVSPHDVLDRLLANSLPSAGWPIINLNDGQRFYDVWAYRTLDGSHFSAQVRANKPFEVSSFGSVWMAPASMFRNRVLDETCCVGLCRQWRAEGMKLTVDPTIVIEQPVNLWRPM